MKKLLLFAAGAMLATSAMAQSWAIVGESTGWGLNEDYVFVEDGDVYTLQVGNLLNSFKVVPVEDGSLNWDYCYSTSTPILLGETYTLDARDGGDDLPNMAFGGDIMSVNQCVITWNPATAEFMATGDPVEQATDGSVIYLIGSPSGWNINADTMPLEASSEGVYTATYEIPANPSFRFYTRLGNWEANSIGSQVADNAINFEMTDGVYEGECVEGKGSWAFPEWNGGTMELTVDLNNMTVKFQAVDENVEPGPVEPSDAPDEIYMIGNILDNDWQPAEGLLPTTAENGVFTFANVTLTGETAWFSFTNILTADWDVINDGSHRYGPVGEAALTVGDSSEFQLAGDSSWNIAGGTYDFIMDFNTMTLTVTAAGESGVESINVANGVETIYNINGVKVSRDNMVKGGLYIINGKKIVK